MERSVWLLLAVSGALAANEALIILSLVSAVCRPPDRGVCFRQAWKMRVRRLLLPLLLIQLAAAAADLYAALGVGHTADNRTLKKAYRKMALQNHPDKQAARSDTQKKAATDDFVAASNAYEVLSNPDKRRLYDRHGEAGLEAGQQAAGQQAARQGGAAQQGGAAGSGAFRDPLEVFEAMFGARGGSGSAFGRGGGGGGGGGSGGGGGGSKVFMDSRGNLYRQAGGAAAAQEARAQQQQQQRRLHQQHQQEQHQRRQHQRQQQQAHHYQQQAAQAGAEQWARQAEFDAEARAHAEAQAARRASQAAGGADSRRTKVPRSKVLNL